MEWFLLGGIIGWFVLEFQDWLVVKIKNILESKTMKYKVGQVISVDGDSSFCQPYNEVITDIKVRFDIITGTKYQLLICGNNHYRSDTGACVKGASAYYLVGPAK